MIINDMTILSKFKTECFCKLTVEEKKKLATDFIHAIIKERQLPDVEIRFSGEEFGYDPNGKILYISESSIENNSLNSNFELMTGIIHELRHREQDDNDHLFYTGMEYALSPREIDAHRFASSELVKLSDFFNDNEFDKYVYQLMNNDAKDINYATNSLLLYGYSREEIPLMCEEQARFTNHFVVDSQDEKQTLLLNSKPIIMASKYVQKGMTEIFINNIRMYIVDGELFVEQFIHLDDVSGENFVKNLQDALTFIKQNQAALNIKEIQNVHFAPLHLIRNKKEKERLYEILGLQNNSTTLSGLMSMDPEREDLKKLNISDSMSSTPEINLKKIFGIDYQERYSEDQQAFLESMLDYIDECDERRLFPDPDEQSEAYFAVESYKPEYSLEKLKLIFSAQQMGLNTMYYDSLSEEQIRILMEAQKKGISREEIKELISSFKKGEANVGRPEESNPERE